MSYIPIDLWGKDHWSTLAYIETVMVDCSGFQIGQDPHMRSNRRHWRVMREECPRPKRVNRSAATDAIPMHPGENGTRLSNNSVVDDHDDWMCLQDMAEAGLFTCDVFGVQPGKTLYLSPYGLRLASDLREHKAKGGTFGNFKATTFTAS